MRLYSGPLHLPRERKGTGIRNYPLVGGRARALSNPGHWARHALLHMAAECVNQGKWTIFIQCSDKVGLPIRNTSSSNQKQFSSKWTHPT